MLKTSHFLALFVDISKTVGDTSKVRLPLITNRKLPMRFRLALRSMNLGDFKVQ